MAAKLFERLFAASFRMINRRRVWHRLPFVLSVANLAALRIDLRRRNLFDTETAPPDPAPPGDFDVRRCRKMTIRRTCPDSQWGPADEGRPATYRNTATHSWDASQMYGSDLGVQHRVRSSNAGLLPDGKLHLDESGHLPLDPQAADKDPDQELAAVNGNWWIGLSTMHTRLRVSTMQSSIACI